MWMNFVVAVCLFGAFLYLPGFLLLKSLRFSVLSSLTCAPPLVLAAYGVLAMAYAKAGVRSSWLSLFLPLTILFGLVLAIALLVRRRSAKQDSRAVELHLHGEQYRSVGRQWLIAAAYCAMGIVTTGYVFVKCLDGPESISQLFDNAWHLSIIRNFVDTGNYSTITSGSIVPTVGSKFYPTGWHSMVAMVASATGFPLGVCENATIAGICAFVLPLSMYALLSTLFARNTLALTIGAATPLMFAAYPWRFITFGPLYSNLLSFAVLPLAMVLLLRVLDAQTALRARLLFAALLLVAIVGIAITQPNAVFTLAVLASPYLYYQIPRYARAVTSDERRLKSVVIGMVGAVSLAIVLMWRVLYNASFMQRTVQWSWPSIESKSQALIDVAFVGFHGAEPQILLGLLIAIGIAYTIARTRYLWITCAYVIMCVMYALSIATEGRAKNVLTGFWYHDAYRLGASAVFFGAFLAAAGMYCMLRLAERCMDAVAVRPIARGSKVVLAFFAVVLTSVVNFFPSYYLPGRMDVTTAFGAIRRDITYWNASGKPKSYDEQERAFVAKVNSTVPVGALVINQPYDGSVYAYSLDGLNVYYKAWEGNWMGKPTAQNYTISTKLNRIASDDEACRAVKDSGAQYVMLLNRADYQRDPDDSTMMTSMYAHYIAKNWKGIDSVNDNTPGLTLALKQGPMRLYRIDPRCTR